MDTHGECFGGLYLGALKRLGLEDWWAGFARDPNTKAQVFMSSAEGLGMRPTTGLDCSQEHTSVGRAERPTSVSGFTTHASKGRRRNPMCRLK